MPVRGTRPVPAALPEPGARTRAPSRGTGVKEFRWQVRVYYEDTDAAGLVYHGNYLKFMERARTEWLRAMGYTHELLRERHGIVFVVSEANVRFVRPARMDDHLTVHVTLERAGGASLDFLQYIENESGGRICEATVRIACLDVET